VQAGQFPVVFAKAIARPPNRWHPISVSDGKTAGLQPFRKRDPLTGKR
jgi:hypothetical protein